MKIIFVITESTIDHSYTMINELRRHLELEVYLIAKKQTPELEDFCNKLKAKFILRDSFKNPWGIFKELKLLNELKKQKADLVWFNRISFYQSIFLKIYVKNFIINVHDVELHPEEKDYHGIITQKIIFRYYRDHIAVMSRSQGELLEKKIGTKPAVLQLPIIDYYRNTDDYILNESNNQNGKIKFFFFGSILPYKGIEKLIQAASILNLKNITYELNIYGKLRYSNKKLLNTINENKNINFSNRFINYKKVSEIFRTNDIIIIPYLQVSQCGPLLIAYSYGIPVMCSKLPGFSEYVVNNYSGLLFERSPEDIAASMEYIIKNPNLISLMKTYIQTEIKALFSMESLAKDYISIFNQYSGKET